MRVRRALVLCGAIASTYYVAMNLYVPLQWEGYSLLSQVPSELSAIDAPTRALWVRLAIVYSVLMMAFGAGVWMSAEGSRALRTVGALFVVNAVLGLFWPPMHMRGLEATLTDTLHIVWTALWLLTMLAAMGLAASVLGRGFRWFTFATLMVFVVFGTLTAIAAPSIAMNAPTPWIGLWERINIAASMIWIAGLGIALWRDVPHPLNLLPPDRQPAVGAVR